MLTNVSLELHFCGETDGSRGVVSRHNFLEEAAATLSKLDGVKIQKQQTQIPGAQIELITVSLLISLAGASLYLIRQVYGLLNDIAEKRASHGHDITDKPRLVGKNKPDLDPVDFPAPLSERERAIANAFETEER